MADLRIVVIYPRPTDVDVFEKAYLEEHIPLAMEKIKGPLRFVASKMIGTPDGSAAPFYRIAEFYFSSMEALQECAASPGTQEAVAHAISISTGGPPIIMIAEEQSKTM